MNSPPPSSAKPGAPPPPPDRTAPDPARRPAAVHADSIPRIRTSASDAAFAFLHRLAAVLEEHDIGRPPASFDVTAWRQADRDFLNQVLGEGEVSIVVGETVHIQESVLAGVWRVVRRLPDGGISDGVEVGAAPRAALAETFAEAAPRIDRSVPPSTAEWMNGPALLAEIDEHLAERDAGEGDRHVINLTLLPVTDGDLQLLMERLGAGPTAILSRGYGNCRMSATATRPVWWVQYFNPQDALILNHLEIAPVPQAACAAAEDLRDSARRLHEILEAYA